MLSSASAGAHYPGSYAELLAWFRDDDDALYYLEWLRWGDTIFTRSTCGSDCGWRLRSDQTAWTMLHRYRSVMRDPARTCLAGTVVGGQQDLPIGG